MLDDYTYTSYLKPSVKAEKNQYVEVKGFNVDTSEEFRYEAVEVGWDMTWLTIREDLRMTLLPACSITNVSIVVFELAVKPETPDLGESSIEEPYTEMSEKAA